MATQTNIYAGLVNHHVDGLPKRTKVKLGTGVSVGMGELMVLVGGYGVRPAVGNQATGKAVGITLQNVDNSDGSDGDLEVVCEDGVRDFKNDGTHACDQTNVGKEVYATDKETVSDTSGDGPPIGVLEAYNPSDAEPGRPCRVKLYFLKG